jgi:hypothetical protein
MKYHGPLVRNTSCVPQNSFNSILYVLTPNSPLGDMKDADDIKRRMAEGVVDE